MPTIAALVTLAALPTFVPFTSKSDAFSAEFPGTPKVQSAKEQGKAGGQALWSIYMVEISGGALAVAVQTDAAFASYTAADVQRELDELRAESKRRGSLEERPVATGTTQGVELRVQGKSESSISRVFFSEGRFYVVKVQVGAGTSAKALDAERFLSSFKLLPQAADAKTKEGLTRAVGALATVRDLVVTANAEPGNSWGLTLQWTSELRSPGDDPFMVVEGSCILADGKREKALRVAADGALLAGKPAGMKASLQGLSKEPKRCELSFTVALGRKSEAVEVACWTAPNQRPQGGLCKD